MADEETGATGAEENPGGGTALGTGTTDNPAPETGGEGNPGDANGDAPSTEEGSPDGKDPDGADDSEAAGAPESYADFTLPDGMSLNTEMLEAATSVFKELNLTQEQAQKLVDIQAKHVQATEQHTVDAFNQQLDDWLTEAKADPEIGGDKFDGTVKAANRAIDAYGDAGVRALMDQYGIGNHPAVIRMLAKIGEPLKEDNPGGNSAPTSAGKDRKSIMYKT